MSITAQVEQAALGAIAGLALGSPHVGRNQFQRLTGYSPIPSRMTPNPSLDAWLIWRRAHLDNRLPGSYGQILLDSLEDHSDETAFGLFNLRRGFGTPYSGTLDNPLGNGSRALLRSLIWGILNHGSPESALNSAFHDASIDHSGDGAWIPTAFALALSQSNPGDSAQTFYHHITSALPSESALHRVGPLLTQNIGHPEAPQTFANQFTKNFPALARDGITATAAFTLLGLLHADHHTEAAMLLTAGCGGQADQSSATCAAIASFLWSPLPPDYIGALDPAYLATHSLTHLEPPATIIDFATLIATAAPIHQLPEPIVNEPIFEESEKTDSAPSEPTEPEIENPDTLPTPEAEETQIEPDEDQKTELLQPLSQPVSLASQPKISPLSSTTTSTELAGLIITADYLETPLAAPPAKKLQISIHNPTNEVRNLSLALTGPDGWQVASRVSDCTIRPGEETKFPAVIQPPAAATIDCNLRLKLDNYQLLIPFLPPNQFWIVGPFVNIEGTGYSQEHPPEKNDQKIQSMAQPFSGRSEMGIRWTLHNFPNTEFDLEPIFNGGAGVTYLYAHVNWNTFGQIYLQAQFPGGLKIWVDGKLILSYNDSATKPFNHPSGQAEFTTAGESRILIKLTRGRDQIPPFRLAFSDESGRIIVPREFIVDP